MKKQFGMLAEILAMSALGERSLADAQPIPYSMRYGGIYEGSTETPPRSYSGKYVTGGSQRKTRKKLRNNPSLRRGKKYARCNTK